MEEDRNEETDLGKPSGALDPEMQPDSLKVVADTGPVGFWEEQVEAAPSRTVTPAGGPQQDELDIPPQETPFSQCSCGSLCRDPQEKPCPFCGGHGAMSLRPSQPPTVRQESALGATRGQGHARQPLGVTRSHTAPDLGEIQGFQH